jgi:hypothetical protein
MPTGYTVMLTEKIFPKAGYDVRSVGGYYKAEGVPTPLHAGILPVIRCVRDDNMTTRLDIYKDNA